jgi:hypothetical protein
VCVCVCARARVRVCVYAGVHVCGRLVVTRDTTSDTRVTRHTTCILLLI